MRDFSSAFAEKFATAFQDAATDAGFLIVATVRPTDCSVKPYDLSVGFERPDMLTNAAAQSTDWEIEYVASAAPLLAEGDEVEIEEVLYRVRRAPYVSAGGEGGVDGTFMRALLTRVAGDCE